MTPGSWRSVRIASMRAFGLPLALLCGACSFQFVGATDGPPGGDDGGDGGGGDDGGGTDGQTVAAYRKRIRILASQVSGNQPQFPVWISFDGDDDLKMHATTSGTDIYFVAAGGLPLPHQLQRWDKTTGRLEAWVRVDLADTTDTMIELRFGDPGAASTQSPTQVFMNSFAAVWHLDDALTSNAVADAIDQRPGTAGGGLGPSDQVTGRLGGGIDFDGNDDNIQFDSPYTGNTDHTISAWVNQRGAAGFDSIVALGVAAPNQSRWLHSHYTSGLSAGFFGNDWPNNPSPLPNIDNAGWVLIHWTYKASNRQSRIYRNGAEVAAHTFNNGVATAGNVGILGYSLPQFGPGGNSPCALNGLLDEVRLATTDRSAGWAATEFANQGNPAAFYMASPAEKL